MSDEDRHGSGNPEDGGQSRHEAEDDRGNCKIGMINPNSFYQAKP